MERLSSRKSPWIAASLAAIAIIAVARLSGDRIESTSPPAAKAIASDAEPPSRAAFSSTPVSETENAGNFLGTSGRSRYPVATLEVARGSRIEAPSLLAAPGPLEVSAQRGFEIPGGPSVRATLFDFRGRRVRSLVRDWDREGRQSFVWDGRDQTGRRVSAGSYFLRLESDQGDVLTRTVNVVS